MPALGDDADVGRRAADVEGDQALAAGRLAGPLAAEHARRPGPESSSVTGSRPRPSRAGDAAVRHHHVQLAADAPPASALGEPVEVAAGRGPDERVHRRGREALELAELREDVGARGDERVRDLLGDDLRGAPLVLRVEVGEEEADRDRLDAGLLQRAGRGAHLVLVERLEHLAARRHDPLAHDVAGAGGARTAAPATGCPA